MCSTKTKENQTKTHGKIMGNSWRFLAKSSINDGFPVATFDDTGFSIFIAFFSSIMKYGGMAVSYFQAFEYDFRGGLHIFPKCVI